MAKENAARTGEIPEESQGTSFTNESVVLADNGHGKKVKLWTNKRVAHKGQVLRCSR